MDLIKIEQDTIGGEEVQTVDARMLHEFLKVGRDFSNWIRGRIAEYGFIDGQDFVTAKNFCSPNSASKGRGGHNAREYPTLASAVVECVAWYDVRCGECEAGSRAASQASVKGDERANLDMITKLRTFLDSAASDGFVLNDVDAADLYMLIFDADGTASDRLFSNEVRAIAFQELFDFQEATGCDTAAEYRAAAPQAGATLTDEQIEKIFMTLAYGRTWDSLTIPFMITFARALLTAQRGTHDR